MEWTFGDGTKLVLNNITANLIKFNIKLFTGTELPVMELYVQYGDDNNHYELGSEVTGSISAGGNYGSTYNINGFVYEMQEGSRTIYKILLRPKSYTKELNTSTYDSIKSALDSLENTDVKGTIADGPIHGFNNYPVRIVNKLAPGYINGVFGRSYDKLIFRELKSPADFTPDINNIIISSVSSSVYNKFLEDTSSKEVVGSHEVVMGSGNYFSTLPEYSSYYNNVIINTRFNYTTTVSVRAQVFMPFEPGLIVDTTKINQRNDPKIPDLTYVKDVYIWSEGSSVKMQVTLAGDSKQ